jgi:lysophospholipase L1-like esterase
MKEKDLKKAKKERIFFAVYITFLILCVVLSEVLLRLVGFGIDTKPFHKVKINGTNYYRDNTSFINKYYPSSSMRIKTEEKNLFPVKKVPGSIRGFVVGGSTAQGYPYASNQSFSAFLQRSLRDANKAKSVDVINMGYSAMSSYYVADAAKKILRYKPDFLIIYAGHNEYYGTISAMSGQSHNGRKNYLFLKEFRLFQLFDKLLHFKSASNGGKTLMDRQFSGAAFVQNEETDTQVAKNFVNNISEVVKLYAKKNIPVIIYEPVSNLFDMPPFAGKDDATHRNLIEKSLEALGMADDTEIKKCRDSAKKIADNANLAYLEAVYLAREGQDSYYQLVKGKDSDCIPFRARSLLTSELEKKCTASNYRNLFYIPTSTLMRNEGIIPDNSFFADHLHFSIAGNRWIARQAAVVLENIFESEHDKLFEIFEMDNENFCKQFPLSQLDRYRVAGSILSLVKNQPFTSMIIPYYPQYPVENENIVTSDAALYRAVRDCKQEDFYLNACAYFLRSGKYIQAKVTAQSFVSCFPANAKAHDFLAQSLDALGLANEAKNEKNIASSLANSEND